MKLALLAGLLITLSASAFEVQGHRGARWVRPENTLSAFRYALEAGVDTLELDLNVTQDNVLVVTHDPYLNPNICVDANGNRIGPNLMIRKLTLAQLKTYDCGKRNPKFPNQIAQTDEKIPTFEEFLTWLTTDSNPRAKTVLLNVETKSEEAHPEYTPNPETFSKMVIQMAKKFGVLNRMTLQSFDFRTLVAARALEPNLTLSALIEDRPRESLVAIAKRLDAKIISPQFTWLKASDVTALHAIGVRVIPWTLNSPADWKRAVSISVDGIISDNPKALLDFRDTLK